MLIPVSLLCNLKYAVWQLPGAHKLAWLEEACLERLHEANHRVRLREGAAQIVVWDALRSLETQRHIYDVERAKFAREHHELTEEQIDQAVSQYVRPPRADMPPPHTTGGAVDVTLWMHDRDDLLGAFDDFSQLGRSDYYEKVPPQTEDAKEQAYLRFVLGEAMRESGFVGIPEEWWHWEYGTRLWAKEKDIAVKFNEVQKPPTKDSFSARLPLMPSRVVVDVHGVAQAFANADDRADALAGRNPEYYYARTRHHNERQLASSLSRLIDVEDAVALPSGLSAVVAAVASNMSAGGTALVDYRVYYEAKGALSAVGEREGWSIREADFSNPVDIKHSVAVRPQVLFVDHPRNWHLSCPDLFAIRDAFSTSDARVIVDVSVQPLQKLVARGLADLVVISLSKYPSQGNTMGGMVAGKVKHLHPVRRYAEQRGLVLAPEAAETVSDHLASLGDRMKAVSDKAIQVVHFLRGRPEVEEVYLPDLSAVGALPGGQITVKFSSLEIATAVEEIVGWNSGSPGFPLALACTFGASFTTFEHFVGRGSLEQQLRDGSAQLGDRLVRIGLGHEDPYDIMSALTFVINSATNNLDEICERFPSLQSDQLAVSHG